MSMRVVRWIVADGEQVRPGDFICEIEADSATHVAIQELEADETGTLRHLKKEGEYFAPYERVCRIEK